MWEAWALPEGLPSKDKWMNKEALQRNIEVIVEKVEIAEVRAEHVVDFQTSRE
jgi:hypothetical protein